jgi:hypothetical protein
LLQRTTIDEAGFRALPAGELTIAEHEQASAAKETGTAAETDARDV